MIGAPYWTPTPIQGKAYSLDSKYQARADVTDIDRHSSFYRTKLIVQ